MQPLSLKQVLSFISCPRQWGAKWLFKADDPKNPYAQEGIDFHAACEAWLKTRSFDFDRRTRKPDGTWVSERVAVPPESHLGKLATLAVSYAPAGALPEMNQAFTLFGRTVEAHIDCLWPDWSEFADWKSSGGYREITNETLHADIQANWQAHGMMVGSGRETISGLWLYADKKTYKARPARGTFRVNETQAFLRQRVEPVFDLIETFVDLHAQGRITDVAQIPHDITACNGTGKFCNFLGRCQMRPSTGATLAQIRNYRKDQNT